MKKLLPIILPAFIFAIVQTTFGQIKNNWQFKEELISYMQTPSDTIYIEDRKKLEKIAGIQCNDSSVTFNSRTKSGDSIFIGIKNKKFIKAGHSIYLSDTVFKFIHNEKRIDYLISKNLIDGKWAFGIDGSYPSVEMKEIKIKWKNSWLTIPDSAFRDLYQTHLCLSYIPVEGYITAGNKFLYLYITASDGAGSYSVKFVFNGNGYVTRIINRNECAVGYDFLDANGNCD